MKRILAALLLAGCGGLATSDGYARLDTPTNQLQRHTVQVVRATVALTDADVAAQIEAVNIQLQGSFKTDWHIDALCVAGPAVDRNGLVIYLQDFLPDASRAYNIGGYHVGNQAWVSLPNCNAADPNEWRESLGHELLEMLADESAGTSVGNIKANLGIAKRLEICDQVSSHRYAAIPGGPEWLSDYTLPSAWALAPAIRPFDHLDQLMGPTQALSGGRPR